MTLLPLKSTERATLERQGWTLVSAEALFAAGNDVFWLPSDWDRQHADDWADGPVMAKLPFRILSSEEPGRERGEFMWVELLSVEGGRYHGELRNEPHTRGLLHENEHLDFGPEHILDLADDSGRQASDASNVVRCDQHGRSEPCYVCEHLLTGKGLGFIAGGDPRQRRPDAWCARCDSLVANLPSWDEVPPDRHPRIVLVCGGCYETRSASGIKPYRRGLPPNKRLKLTAPGLGENCVYALARSLLVSSVVAPTGFGAAA